MNDTDIRSRVTDLAPTAMSFAAFGLVLVLITLVLTGSISRQTGAVLGTLALAMITAMSVYSNFQQSQYMYEDLRFRRRPQISVYQDTSEGAGWFVMENTGEVPVIIEFDLALVRSPCPSEQHAKILDQSVSYADLPDAVKVQEHGWDEAGGEYIEPKESTGWTEGFIESLLVTREGRDEREQAICWLRIDAELHSQYDERDSRSKKWLFEVMIGDHISYGSKPFKRARTIRKRRLQKAPEYDDPEFT